jgi:hypothetical protein
MGVDSHQAALSGMLESRVSIGLAQYLVARKDQFISCKRNHSVIAEEWLALSACLRHE